MDWLLFVSPLTSQFQPCNEHQIPTYHGIESCHSKIWPVNT